MMQIKNNFKLLYVAMAISVGLAIPIAKLPSIINLKTISLYGSAVIGYMGIMMLLWMFILGTRSVISWFTDDFAKAMKVHNWLGKYGVAAIFLHPLLIIISYGESWFYSFIPSFSSEFNRAVTYGRSAFWILLVIWITSAVIRSKVSYRPWKYLHLGAYLTLPFALLHVPDTGSSYASMLTSRIYFFSVVGGLAVFALFRLRGALNINKSSYKISRHQQIKSDVFLLEMMPTNTYSIKPELGQYVYIKYGWFSEDHPFTVLDYDGASGRITLGYRVFGEYTRRLSAKTVGQRVWLTGPFGHFTSDIGSKPVVYMAGGIGITPFVQRIIKQKGQREQWLFYATKSPETAVFLSGLRQSLGDYCVSIFSRQKVTASNAEYGYITREILAKYLSDPTKYNYYICGPAAMIETVTRAILASNVDESRIHLEQFEF